MLKEREKEVPYVMMQEVSSKLEVLRHWPLFLRCNESLPLLLFMKVGVGSVCQNITVFFCTTFSTCSLSLITND
uniref:Uncharacterized protein n=1 Tax=Rhizophora mucronata TaxID=61149 RepID=A0A2P2QV87_RHIMU